MYYQSKMIENDRRGTYLSKVHRDPTPNPPHAPNHCWQSSPSNWNAKNPPSRRLHGPTWVAMIHAQTITMGLLDLLQLSEVKKYKLNWSQNRWKHLRSPYSHSATPWPQHCSPLRDEEQQGVLTGQPTPTAQLLTPSGPFPHLQKYASPMETWKQSTFEGINDGILKIPK